MTDYAATVPPRFMAELDLRYLGWHNGRPLFRLLEPFTYFSKVTQKGYTVPAGFEFNGPSVPRVPLAYLLFGERGFLASAVHDWLVEHPEIEPRSVADRIYREALGVEGLAPVVGDAMYAGVRIGAGEVDQAGFVTGNADG